MEKESFVFYQSFWEVVKRLPEDTGNRVLRAIIEYGIEQNEYSGDDVIVSAIMAGLAPQIDASKANRIQKTKGGQPGNKNASKSNRKGISKTNKNECENEYENECETNSRIYVNVNGNGNGNGDVNVNDLEKEIIPPNGVIKEKKPVARFIKPTLEEVTEYCKKMNYIFSPEAFFAHYESNGWKVNRNPMKNWHMACVTWQTEEKRRVAERQERYGRASPPSPPPKEQIKSPIPEYTDEEWNRLDLWEQDKEVHRHFGLD